MTLLAELRRVQGDRSLYRFAKDLGIGYSTLWRFYHGQSGLSRRVAQRICQQAPGLSWAVAQHFVSGDRAA